MSNGTRLILIVIGLIHRVHDLEELVSSRRELRQSIRIPEVMEIRIILYLYSIEALGSHPPSRELAFINRPDCNLSNIGMPLVLFDFCVCRCDRGSSTFKTLVAMQSALQEKTRKFVSFADFLQECAEIGFAHRLGRPA